MPPVSTLPSTVADAPDSFAGSPVYPPPMAPREYRWGVTDEITPPLWSARVEGFALFWDRIGSGPYRFYAWDCERSLPAAALTVHGWMSPNGTPWAASWLVRASLALAAAKHIQAIGQELGDQLALEMSCIVAAVQRRAG
jgi:hypothetical protein